MKIFDELHDLLDQEKYALLSGNLDGVSKLLEEKQRLTGQISHLSTIEEKNKSKLRSKIDRNQKLIKSAMEGILYASNRISELHKAGNELNTYNRSGERVKTTSPLGRKIEKRS